MFTAEAAALTTEEAVMAGKAAAAKPRHDFAEIAIALSTGLALAVASIYLCLQPLMTQFAGGRDFVVYWATGQQLVHHANPYDGPALAALEHGAGFPGKYTVGYMRNPPWSLFLTLPLGLVGIRVGSLFWSLLEVFCLVMSARLLWILYGRQQPPVHWMGLAFAPAILCAIMGQTSAFSMLGFVLFLYTHDRRPFLAGASLWLCMLKPHLFLPFWPVLLIWIVCFRRSRILAGAAAALAASCVLSLAVDPHAWTQYAQMIRHCGMEREPIPCLGIMLRLWLKPQATWIQYAPVAVGCLWALVYYWRRRSEWNWLRNGAPILVVSVMLAPYCWLYDQGVAIPGLLRGAYDTRSRWLLFTLAVLNTGTLIAYERFDFTSQAFLWTGPVWLIWYFAASRFPKRIAPTPVQD